MSELVVSNITSKTIYMYLRFTFHLTKKKKSADDIVHLFILAQQII